MHYAGKLYLDVLSNTNDQSRAFKVLSVCRKSIHLVKEEKIHGLSKRTTDFHSLRLEPALPPCNTLLLHYVRSSSKFCSNCKHKRVDSKILQ